MNYQLTQTGEQVQDILNQAPTTEETLQAEITRSTNKDDALELAIGNEKTRAEGAEANLQTAIGNEKTRAEGAEANLQTAIGNEKTRAELIEGGLRTDVDGIEAKIPTGASSENKLATENFVNSSVATNTADFKGTYNSLEALETAVPDANANDYAFVISTDAAGNTVYNRYKYVEGTGWVFEYALNSSSFTSAQWAAINSAITAALVAKLTGLPTATELTTQLNAIIDSVATEKSRAEGIESGLRTDVNANATAIGTEKTRAEGVEGNLSTAIGNEKTRAEAAELLLQQNINAEALLRGNADTALQGEIDGINAKIPAAASASNQLADKTFVNSSIATNTATFRGTYNSVAALDEVTADNNDYAFVVATDTAGNTVYNRYKYVEGSGWVFEYALNNSSFTATQWAAVNSGITAALVTKLDGLPDNTALAAMFTAITSLIPAAATSDNKLVDYAQLVAGLATKQNTLTFDNVPVENSSNPVKSGGVYSAIATVTAAVVGLQSSKQDVLTFDTYPKAGSDNPVKSKGIYEKLAEKQATLTFDDAPTAGSSNPVKSSGIKSAIDTVAGSVTTLAGSVSTNEADIAALQAAYAALTESDPVVVSPIDTWPVSNPQQNVIYRVVDRVNTPPQYYSDYMWNGTSMVLMATYNNAIDDVPTAGSNNLVKSGGVFKEVDSLEYSLSSTGLPVLAGYGREDATLENTILRSDGRVITQVDYCTSPLCEIPEGTTILEWIGLFPQVGNNCGLCIYDENGGFLAAVAGSVYNAYNGNAGKFDLTQYPSAKFLRFTPFFVTYHDRACYILCSKGDVDINSLLNGHIIDYAFAPHADAIWIFYDCLNDRGDIFVNFHSQGNRINMGIYDSTDRKWLLENRLWNEEFRYVSIPEGHRTQVYAFSMENNDVPVALEILPKSAINDILIAMTKKQNDIPEIINIGQGKDYTTLREGISHAYGHKNAVVYVYPGVYDLMSEFAAEIEAHTGYKGILLGNGMHIIFMPGAYVKANYVPSGNEEKDNWVQTYFQPFYTDNSYFIIENLDIEASNTRYCVHDELAGRESQYIHRFVNCHMKYSNTFRESPTYLQCIGGGIGKNAYIEVVGGMYESYNISDTNHTAISYHNGNNENADSVFIVRDAYIANNNYIRFGAYGPSTIPVKMYVSGCSMGGYIRNIQEIPGGNATLAELIEWNNTIR